MAEHSPEPWKLESWVINPGDAYAQVIAANWKAVIHEVCNEDELPPIMDDLRRIVACVNACRGVPTDHLTDPESVIICVPKQFALNISRHIQRGIDNAQS